MGKSLWDTKSVKEFLRNILEKPELRDDFELEYRAGHTAFHYRVYITITFKELIYKFIPRGTPVEDLEEKKIQEVKRLILSEKTAKNFIKGLIDNSIWDLVVCSDAVPPDSALLKFEIRQKGEKIWDAISYSHCIDMKLDERIKKIVDLFRTIVLKLPMTP